MFLLHVGEQPIAEFSEIVRLASPSYYDYDALFAVLVDNENPSVLRLAIGANLSALYCDTPPIPLPEYGAFR